MVVRKPISAGASSHQSQSSPSALPYPASPTSSDRPNASSYISNPQNSRSEAQNSFPQDRSFDSSGHLQHSHSYGSDMSDDWANEDLNAQEPGIKRPTANNGWPQVIPNQSIEQLPSALRAGPPDETPRTSSESQRSRGSHDYTHSQLPRESSLYSTNPTNPYYRAKSSDRKSPGLAGSIEESSVDIWAELASGPPPTRSAPPPPPPPPPPVLETDHSETDQSLGQIDNLSISDHPAGTISGALKNDEEPPLISFEEVDGHRAELISQPLQYIQSLSERQNDRHFDNLYSSSQDQQHENPQELSIGSLRHEEPPLYPDDAKKYLPVIPTPQTNEETAPSLPPRKPLNEQNERDIPPQQPPRPLPTHISPESFRDVPKRVDVESSQDLAKKQRGETYQIKHINWVDSSSNAPRTSPIMVQNANGPCPLLALVNALTLSTPAHANTALIETLRVREQVSLGLLLDAVFDELMSGRRGDTAQELPDVGQLYRFLVTLHTGMNVNPRFIPLRSQPQNSLDKFERKPLNPVYDNRRPGGFEETREMKLYSTFSIPLIHGWLPPRNHPAFAALERSARTYEDAQNLMFHEEALEEKLQHEGLNQDEQVLLEDIASIKYFLSSSATQLTGYGLDTITEALSPGSIAILFRNDHFSTLYKHPRSGQLLTLVTDMGYAGHDEVVWESLVDVRGEGCEFFAGDFRPVGNTPGDTQKQANTSHGDGGWTTVSRSGRKNTPKKPLIVTTNKGQGTSMMASPHRSPIPPLDHSYSPPMSPNTEQEDHDLALAMQLQEEEEDRSRRDAEARRREDELSRAYLDSQEPVTRRGNASRGQTARPSVPPRGGSHATSRGTTTNVATPSGASNVVSRGSHPSRLDPEAGEEAPPPSYEQAAKSLPYNPPTNQPPYSNASPAGGSGTPGNTAHGTRPRQLSAYSQQASLSGSGPSFYARRENASRNSLRGGYISGIDGEGLVRRRSAGVNAGSFQGEEDTRNKDCIVM